MGPYGAIWVPYETHMDPIRVPYASHMDPSGPIWDPYGPIWTHMGRIWTLMGCFTVHVGPYVGHVGRYATYVLLLVHVERSAWLLVIAYEQGGRVGLDGTPLGSGDLHLIITPY